MGEGWGREYLEVTGCPLFVLSLAGALGGALSLLELVLELAGLVEVSALQCSAVAPEPAV